MSGFTKSSPIPLLSASVLVLAALVLWVRQPAAVEEEEEPPVSMDERPAEIPITLPAHLADSTDAGPGRPKSADPAVSPAAGPPVIPPLSVLAEPPDWSSLDAYQHTITRKDFEALLTGVFTTGDAWRAFIELTDDHATVRTASAEDDDVFVLQFASSADEATPVSRGWRPGDALPPASYERPLDGIHIAIDPGHIGGKWARMEERWFSVGGLPPVTEGDMTLKVAHMLKPVLEKLGARVTLLREKAEPITPMRPESLVDVATDQAADPASISPAALQRLAERLFYRTAEIRARAHVVNHAIRPDLVLCLHFNAEAWGNPARPTLVDRTHFHLLLNGAYTDSEVALADQRFAMLRKLLQRTHEEEAAVGATVADVFAAASGLPAFTYPENSAVARQVAGHPYLWARNLLANRLYDCPVVFLEPYVMNSRQDHARIQAGDYQGLREIDEVPRPSIYREYVHALADGLAAHYRTMRSAAR